MNESSFARFVRDYYRRHRIKAAACAPCSAFTAGCTSRGSEGTVRRHYFPYAVVTTPPVAPDGQRITVREVRSYGLAFGHGSTLLGHGREHHVMLPPDGRMYLVVRTDEQFQQALKLIESHPELGLYATKDPTP